MTKHGLTAKDRFLLYVEPGSPSECWFWRGGRNDDGYGVFRIDSSRAVRAHRAACELLAGRFLPEGMVSDHTCCEPLCVNPNHIEFVTPRENVLRGVRSGVAFDRKAKKLRPRKYDAKSHCVRGHSYSDAIVDTKTGWRRCRTCFYEKERKRRLRRRSS